MVLEGDGRRPLWLETLGDSFIDGRGGGGAENAEKGGAKSRVEKQRSDKLNERTSIAHRFFSLFFVCISKPLNVKWNGTYFCKKPIPSLCHEYLINN